MDGYLLEGDRIYVLLREEPDDEYLASLQVTIPEVVYRMGVRGMIVDLAALPFLDGSTVRALCELARTVELMGAPTVVCGIGPGTAASLASLGLDLDGLPVAADKERALGGGFASAGPA